MTHQDAFNKIWSGLKAQGFQRALHGGIKGCTLFDETTGRRCSLGHLANSGKGSYLSPTYDAMVGVLGGDSHHFIESAISAHDLGTTPVVMESRLRMLAEKFGLTVPE